MDKLDLNSFTKEQIAMAKQCKTPEELIELAKKAGIELVKEFKSSLSIITSYP